jgi:YVTN family beta-propeller protein
MKNAKLICAITLAIMTLAASPESQTPTRRTKLYVTNSTSDDLTVIDPVSMQVIGSVKVGDNPHGLIPSPDGRKLYVSIEGTGELIALDTATDKVLARTSVGRAPNQIAITPDGRYVFVPLRGEAAVAVVDVESMKVVDHVPVPAMPHNAYASANGKHIYIGSMMGSRITVIDAATHKVLHEIAPGNWVRPIAIKRDESFAYAALSELHGFVVVDLKTQRVVRRIELPSLPPGTPEPYLKTYTHGLALTSNERELYVTSMPGNAVFVFSLPEIKQIAKIDVGKDPNWIAVHPDGQLMFVSNSSSNSVSAIDTRAQKVVATIPVGRTPKRLVVVRIK